MSRLSKTGVAALSIVLVLVAAALAELMTSSETASAEIVPTIFLPLLGKPQTGAGTQPTPTPPSSPAPISPTPAPGSEVHTGEGTYYAADGSGNCSFDPSPENLMVAAMNQVDYNNAALCGAYVEITGPKGVVVVRIVDRCPECAAGDIDMSPQAFAEIADLPQGRVPISWRIVSPELPGPIVYHFKEGSNQWWSAVQIRNHRNPIATFEYRTSSGTFKDLPRANYNYFIEEKGMGPGPYTFRVTDIYGHVITDSNIPLIIGGDVPGNAQFPGP